MAKFHLAASFSVLEAAAIIDVPEDTLRTWHARNPTKYLGEKQGHRVWFSALEIYFYAIVRDLTAFGVPVRTAMYEAARLADDADESNGPLRDEAIVVRTKGGVTNIENVTTGTAGNVKESSLFVPLRALWDGVTTKARDIFAKAAA